MNSSLQENKGRKQGLYNYLALQLTSTNLIQTSSFIADHREPDQNSLAESVKLNWSLSDFSEILVS